MTQKAWRGCGLTTLSTNPLSKFVTKQQVLGMVQSGFLVITSYERRIEYAHVYGDIVILTGSETVAWGGKISKTKIRKVSPPLPSSPNSFDAFSQTQSKSGQSRRST